MGKRVPFLFIYTFDFIDEKYPSVLFISFPYKVKFIFRLHNNITRHRKCKLDRDIFYFQTKKGKILFQYNKTERQLTVAGAFNEMLIFLATELISRQIKHF